jgi:hypothetical protein
MIAVDFSHCARMNLKSAWKWLPKTAATIVAQRFTPPILFKAFGI